MLLNSEVKRERKFGRTIYIFFFCIELHPDFHWFWDDSADDTVIKLVMFVSVKR
jgi:hypothetical protein